MVGVVATVGGEEHCIRARRGVILTAGGYVHNKAMLERYAPVTRRVRFRLGCDGDDGRGIRMGMGVGGDAIRMEAACIVVPFSRNRQFVKGVLVNAAGQRFCAEDLYQSLLGEIGMWRQDGRIWLVLDDALFEKPQLPTEILAVGDTFEELEAEAKIFPKGSLVQTLARYNEDAARGRGSAVPQGGALAPAARDAALRGARPLAREVPVLVRVHARRPAHAADRRGARPGRRDRAGPLRGGPQRLGHARARLQQRALARGRDVLGPARGRRGGEERLGLGAGSSRCSSDFGA